MNILMTYSIGVLQGRGEKTSSVQHLQEIFNIIKNIEIKDAVIYLGAKINQK